MPDEKRIKDFEPATELLIDDWFAVDSPSQGTRKMQASMFQEGLQTQITANTENIALHSGQISVLQQGVGNIGDKVDVLGAAVTVEAYSASKLYAVGEDCVYEGVRYKCITAIETPEAFDPNKWQAISIEGELNELNSSLTSLKTRTNDYIKIKAINVRCSDMSTNMNLSSYVTIDSGYKFFCWQTLGCSNGWISNFPIYISNPSATSGNPFWSGTLGAGYSVVFYYFLIKSNI